MPAPRSAPESAPESALAANAGQAVPQPPPASVPVPTATAPEPDVMLEGLAPGASPLSQEQAGEPAAVALARAFKPSRGREPSLAEWEALLNLPVADSASQLRLTDWRRRIADLYSEVRRLAANDPEEACLLWRAVRELLYRRHPLSPVPLEHRSTFVARHFAYDPSLRFEAPLRADAFARGQAVGGPTATVVLPNSGQELLGFERVGKVELSIEGAAHRLSLFWINGYAGGLFLPFRDATNGTETYGAGRYLLDTAKGADLGSGAQGATIVIDFNFAFQPSCAFDPRWSCPLAPPENRLEIPIRAGERMA